MIRAVLKWAGNILTAVLVVAIGFAIFTMFQSKKDPGYIPNIVGYQPMSVLTGSMMPLLEPGDMIFVKEIETKEVEVGDVVTYRVDQSTLVTHRVVEVIQENGELSFRTKGDANNTEDHALVTNEQLLGSLAFNIPKGGYIANFARSPKGFILFIIVPIFLLIASELKNIWMELGKGNKTNPKNPMDV
ncbi:MAG: signal peptidase [Anaerosolibacter sp.]|jgi:signal peptidase|uniref:signal peptidase I n=1 Tax=Anaerosolibacter sp. TaxID=1872527 RepID=UPI00263542B5|nr:signal peptidase I [Anaerosolibacter sp.]MDF2547565.1 signal peptidase [Anaerosolibacter sp.]